MSTLRRTAWFLACAALAAPLASAQSTQIASSAAAETMAVEPITCWWRTDKPAVRMGEPFTVVLTCSVLDEPSVSVLVDESPLDPTVVQIPPFDVLSGSHPADLHTADRRFFQYQYQLRLINETDFGGDIPLPAMDVSYRVRNVANGEATDTRERGYDLPVLIIKMESLVPDNAADIRDGASETFTDVGSRAFRASALIVSGGVLFTLAAGFVLLAGVRVATLGRGAARPAARLVPDHRVLGGVSRELDTVRRARDEAGWTDELAGRALAALRVAGAYATGQVASQVPGTAESNGHGAIALNRAAFGAGRPVLVSGSATAETVARAINSRSPDATRRLTLLESLQAALARFTAARYGRDGTLDEGALDQALESGRNALEGLRREHTIVARMRAAITSRFSTPQTEARS
jgi:hypothetical protein